MAMPSNTPQMQALPFSLPLAAISAKALDATEALATAQQHIVGYVMQAGPSAIADHMRAWIDLQSAAAGAARSALQAEDARALFAHVCQDALGWHSRAVASSLDGVERVLRVLQTSGQAMASSVERAQASADRVNAEILQTAIACASRLRQLYAVN
jgi:hypothetical protein